MHSAYQRMVVVGSGAGHLFIDYSGFASLLPGGALNEPRVDFSHWLPVDRAWAVPTAPRESTLEASWAWRMSLRNGVGKGHVFASRVHQYFPDPVRLGRRTPLSNIENGPVWHPCWRLPSHVFRCRRWRSRGMAALRGACGRGPVGAERTAKRDRFLGGLGRTSSVAQTRSTSLTRTIVHTANQGRGLDESSLVVGAAGDE